MENDDVVNSRDYRALITLIDNEFDYTTTLTTYMEKMKAVLDVASLRQGHWTRDRVSGMISQINKHKLYFQNIKFAIFDKELYVTELNGEHVLVFANTCVQILPYEDRFDVLVELHRRMDHAGLHRMNEELQKHYFIIETYLTLFLQSCNSCAKYRYMKNEYLYRFPDKKSVDTKILTSALYKKLVPHTILDIRDDMFNDVVKIYFVNMVSKPDGEFQHILVYHDTVTQYTLLRPLVEIDKVEIAMEIFRIITDFGPPKTIEASEVRLLEDVMKIVQLTPIEFNCSIFPKCVERERNLIEFYMNEWMRTLRSTNWATGCYIVQSYMNLKGNEKAIEKLIGKKALETVSTSKFDIDSLWYIIAEDSKDKESKDKDHGKIQAKDIDKSKNEAKAQLKDSESDNDDVIIVNDGNKELATSMPSTSAAKDTSFEATKCHDNTNSEGCFKCSRPIYFDTYKCVACKNSYHLFCAFKSSSEVTNASFSILCHMCQVSYEAQNNE